MSALVDYGSSSEDEDGQALARPAREAALTREVVAINGERPTTGTPGEKATGEKGLLIGPTIPENVHDRADGHTGLEGLSDDMSEQDLIRYVTQASHPMTAIPPSPPGSPNPQLEAKFKRFLELKKKGLHFNEDLAKKSSFRNPALFTTLMDRAGLERDVQYATSLPATVWDADSLPAFAYKEELLKSQTMIRDEETAKKKKQSASGKRTIVFTAADRSGKSSRTSTPGGR